MAVSASAIRLCGGTPRWAAGDAMVANMVIDLAQERYLRGVMRRVRELFDLSDWAARHGNCALIEHSLAALREL